MKILIAEDDSVSRLLLGKIVTKIGHDIIPAVDGNQAWQLYLEHMPDMVISDWMMPGMDGLELCRKIRVSSPLRYAYIMLLTAKDQTSDLVQVFDAGADDYMIKPFKSDELLSRIKSGERIAKLENRHHELAGKLMEKNKKLDEALRHLKKTQATILQSDKMASIGQLAAGVAHEINNPIGFISSNLEALSDYHKDYDTLMDHYKSLVTAVDKTDKIPSNIRELVKAVAQCEADIEIDYLRKDILELLSDCIDGTRRVGKIVADLKTFAHPGNDKKMLMDINKGLESTLNVVANEIKYKAKVTRQFGKIPMVDAWPQKLNQVFMNILINAAQAIEEKGIILVKTIKQGGNVEISIADNGSGIAQENLPKIFNPFFTTKEVGKGTGLGMNIAYNIIKEHGGKIQVQSKLGKGTVFTIVLPGK